MQAWNWASQLELPLVAMRQSLWAARQALAQLLFWANAQDVLASANNAAAPVSTATLNRPAIMAIERVRTAFSLSLQVPPVGLGWVRWRMWATTAIAIVHAANMPRRMNIT
jgi:hypothetical protein